jgi:type IV pilus assembly protein PilF
MQSVGLTLPFLLALASACAPATGNPNAQSPERQSEAQYDLAREYFFKGHPRVALDHVLQADKLDDSNTKALYFTSAIYLEFCSGDRGLTSPDCELGQAESYARKALDHDPHFRDARNLLGNVLILEHKYAEAITTLEPLVKDPSYNAPHLAWGNLGWAQVLEGRLDEGIASLRNAVTQPKFCVGFYRLGVAYEKKGDLATAEQNLTSALQVDSPDCRNLQEAWRERGEVRLKLGHLEQACGDFGKCRDLSIKTDAGRACAAAMTKCPSPAAKKPGAAASARAAEPRRWT